MKHLLIHALLLFLLHPFVFGQMSDQEFFDKIDLNYSGLASVKKAVQLRDYNSARNEYVKFLRARKFPEGWHVNSLPRNYPSQNRLTSKHIAERALVNEFTILGATYRFPGEINWHFNPTDKEQNPGYNGGLKIEWTVQFNRHNFLRHLASAFQSTGNPIYSRKINELVDHWITNAVFEIPYRDILYSSPWRTLEAGIRISTTWPGPWIKAIRSNEMTNNTIIKWAKSWMAHGEYLTEYSGTLNWLTTESKGLYTLSVLFPEFKESSNWEELVYDRLLSQIDSDFYPDGANVEITPHYHKITASSYAEVLRLADLFGKDIEPRFLENVEKMYDYLLKIMQPDRQIPRLNDSAKENYEQSIVDSKIDKIINKPYNQWILTNGASGTEPSFKSVQIPWAGQIAIRDNWTDKANYLLFEYGALGKGSHAHEDKLGVHIAGYGDLFVYEAGRENYGNSSPRYYSISGQAHSVIAIDGLGQSRIGNDKHEVATKLPEADWAEHEKFSYASSTFGSKDDEKYGSYNNKKDLGNWRRHIVQLKPDATIILDVLNPNDNKSHTYHSHFHLNASSPAAVLSGQKVEISEPNRPHFSITPLADEGLKAETFFGNTNPILGWEYFIYEGDRRIPTLRYEKEKSGTTDFAYVFKATPVGVSPVKPNISRMSTEDGIFGIELSNVFSGSSEKIQILIAEDENAKQIKWQGETFDSRALLIWGEDAYDLPTAEVINGTGSGNSGGEEEEGSGGNGGSEGSGGGGEEGSGGNGGSEGSGEEGGSGGENPDWNCESIELISGSSSSAEQSSQAFSTYAGDAIDGDTLFSITMTDMEPNAWWEIDLEEERKIEYIKVWNRSACCQENASKAYLLLSNEKLNNSPLEDIMNNPNVTIIPFETYDGFAKMVMVQNIARYVRIQTDGKYSLMLAEVEVYGCIDTPEPPADPGIGTLLEAECGILGTEWVESFDNLASNKFCISIPDEDKVVIRPSDLKASQIATYDFEVTEKGRYYVFLKGRAKDPDDDSIWVTVEGNDWSKFSIRHSTTEFMWNPRTSHNDMSDSFSWELEPGNHQLKVAIREDGAVLDKILITKVNELPEVINFISGMNCTGALVEGGETNEGTNTLEDTGGTDSSTEENPEGNATETEGEGQTESSQSSVNSEQVSSGLIGSSLEGPSAPTMHVRNINVYSNPFKDLLTFRVNFVEEPTAPVFAHITVMSQFGKMVYTDTKVNVVGDVTINNTGNWGNGIYFLKIKVGESEKMVRIIKIDE